MTTLTSCMLVLVVQDQTSSEDGNTVPLLLSVSRNPFSFVK